MKFDIHTNDYFVDDNNNTSLIYGESSSYDIYNIFKKIISNYNIDNVIDIGSGCGKLILFLSHKFNNIYFEGIEIQKNRYDKAISLLNDTNLTNIYFFNDNFKDTYFGNYDLLFCCNTVFNDEDNNFLYNKILNEFNGVFILFTKYYKFIPFFKEEIIINSSWSNKTPIYIYFKQ